MTRVLSYGEALVDFLPDRSGVRLRDVETFRKTVGGAPANAAVGLARLGCDVALLGKVGADEFGHYLLRALAAEGVNVDSVMHTGEAKTGITFISLDATGDRSFLFFREPSADMTMRSEDVDFEAVEACTVFIAGSNLLTAPEVRAATLMALERARSTERFIVLDPNIRPHLWSDHQEMEYVVRRELDSGDIVKLNEEELELMSRSGAHQLWNELREGGARALIVTRAAAGAEIYWPGGTLSVEAPTVDVVDTTGAGDGFIAGLVCALLRVSAAENPQQLRAAVDAFDASTWERVASFACHMGSEVCKNLGATPALPTAAQVPWERFQL